MASWHSGGSNGLLRLMQNSKNYEQAMKTFSWKPVTIRYAIFVITVFASLTVISPFLPVFRHEQAPTIAPESFFCLSGYSDTPVFLKRPPQISSGDFPLTAFPCRPPDVGGTSPTLQ